MKKKPHIATAGAAAESIREDLRWAAEHTVSCGSDRSCLRHDTCRGEKICRALSPVGRSAGFVEPTASVVHCGYGIPSFKGFLCFCPTRWALHRAEAAAA